MEEITQEMIDGWKKTFGDIYSAVLGDGQKYIYRPMKRIEYKQVIAAGDQNARTYMEEKIVQTCLIFPVLDAAGLGAEKAGTVSTLTELIMAASNFGVNEEPIKL